MEILDFLDELKAMNDTGELKTGATTEKTGKLLDRLALLVEASIKEEIFQDITDQETVYYAPENDTWKSFLAACNSSGDYAKILEEYYDEDQLEGLWQASHIMEELGPEQIKNRFLSRTTKLKVIDILLREGAVCRIDREYQNLQRASLKGLYNLLHEE